MQNGILGKRGFVIKIIVVLITCNMNKHCVKNVTVLEYKYNFVIKAHI